MGETDSIPVIFLAFANDRDDYLAMIEQEREALSGALQDWVDRFYIQVYKKETTSIDDVFAVFTRYPGRIAIFHYGGHANGKALQLEAGGKAEMAHAGGLAQLFGKATGLQLVFLNGCATQGQVKLLLDAGVKLVIATAVKIDDRLATQFAEKFYLSLAAGATIQAAFDAAQALVSTNTGDTQRVGLFRGVSFEGGGDIGTDKVSAALTWGLYVGAGGDEALKWKLPERAQAQVVVRGVSATVGPAAAVNDVLTQRLFETLATFSPEIGFAWENARRSKRQDIRTVRQAIMDAYPAPVARQIMKLFGGAVADADRLGQLVRTYKIVIKLFAFTSLSQLWDVRQARPDLVIAADQQAVIDEMLALTGQTQSGFDYLRVIAAIDAIWNANGVVPFMAETAQLAGWLGDSASIEAQRFMLSIRDQLRGGTVAADAAAALCSETERHLAELMADFAFIVRYKLATIKNIDIIKSRNKAPQYQHKQVLLDRITAGNFDIPELYDTFTDNKSVILMKDQFNVSEYLNMTPFIVDKNALNGADLSSIYFYSHHELVDDSYHYYSVDDNDKKLIIVISDTSTGIYPYYPVADNSKKIVLEFAAYPEIRLAFEEFAAAMVSK